jgi:hypothetical protein
MRFIKKFKFNNLLLITFSAFIFFVFLRFFLFLSFPLSDFMASQDKENTLYAGYPIIQHFTANKNNLRQVNFAIRDFPKFPGDKICFELMDNDCVNQIASDSINFSSLSYPSYKPFKFQAILDSKGESYCAKITFSPLIKRSFFLPKVLSTKFKTDPAVKYYNAGDKNGKGKTYKDQTLAMKPAYGSGSFLNDISTINKRISQYKPWFLKHYWLYAIAFSFMIFSVLLVVLLIFV